jgi:3-oxoacyl-[acyl-carrier-protein] synthase II
MTAPMPTPRETPRVRATPRVVITGVGAVSAWGWNAVSLWDGLVSGRTGLGRAERFDTTGQRTEVAGEVPAEPSGLAHRFPRWHLYSRADRFAVAAADEALRQAGGTPRDADGLLPQDVGLYFGGSTAGMAEGEDFYAGLLRDRAAGKPGNARLRHLGSHQLNGPGDTVARCFGVTGPVCSISSACASGSLALGAALDALRDGEVTAALAGGSDSLSVLTYSGFNSLRAVDPDPCRPFRPDRAGLTLGEGAGVLVLETLERARARDVRPLAELVGAGASCDAHHMTAPQADGAGAGRAIRAALADAGLAPEAVTFVNAHGTGTPLNDVSEARALESVFGERTAELPLSATKGSVGHLLGTSGAIEAVITVLSLTTHLVPPTPGDAAAGEGSLGVDLVTGPPRGLDGGERPVALSTSFGFGGANAAVVLAAWDEAAR